MHGRPTVLEAKIEENIKNLMVRSPPWKSQKQVNTNSSLDKLRCSSDSEAETHQVRSDTVDRRRRLKSRTRRQRLRWRTHARPRGQARPHGRSQADRSERRKLTGLMRAGRRYSRSWPRDRRGHARHLRRRLSRLRHLEEKQVGQRQVKIENQVTLI